MKSLSHPALLFLLAAAGLFATTWREPAASLRPVRRDVSEPVIMEPGKLSRPVATPVVGLTDQMRANMAETQRTLTAAQRIIDGSNRQARRQFSALAREIGMIRSRLDKSLRAAETASAGEWEDASVKLAADYETYVLAVAEAQRLATASIPLPDTNFDLH